MTVSQKIRDARKKAGLTQEELSTKMGIAPQSLAQWECGFRNPKLKTLDRIAMALNIPIDQLLPDGLLVKTDNETNRQTPRVEVRTHRPDGSCTYLSGTLAFAMVHALEALEHGDPVELIPLWSKIDTEEGC